MSSVARIARWEGLTGHIAVYIIPLDNDGAMLHPNDSDRAPLDHILNAAKDINPTHIFLMCHGWRKSPIQTREMYVRWFAGFHNRMCQKLGSIGDTKETKHYRPLYVGLRWDSHPRTETWAAFERSLVDSKAVSTVQERDKQVASGEYYKRGLSSCLRGGSDLQLDVAASLGLSKEALESLKSYIEGGSVSLPYIVKKELAEAVIRDDRDDFSGSTAVAISPSVESAAKHEAETNELIEYLYNFSKTHVVNDESANSLRGHGGMPFLSGVDDILTARWMKRRAANVGGSTKSEVASIIKSFLLLNASNGVHLVAHSFGSKVVLESLRNLQSDGHSSPKVCSLLLLQPAITRWAMTPSDYASRLIPEGTVSYGKIADMISTPIVATWSENDFALRMYPYYFSKIAGAELPPMNESAGSSIPGTRWWKPSSYNKNSAAAALGCYGGESWDDSIDGPGKGIHGFVELDGSGNYVDQLTSQRIDGKHLSLVSVCCNWGHSDWYTDDAWKLASTLVSNGITR